MLFSVGELQKRKNQKVVIDALHKLNNPDIIYLIAGRGELEEDYQKLIHNYKLEKNIKLLGYRTDIDILCKISDCFVHPSVREGFGIAPMEAMAAGLPLIASGINGIRESMENGKTGYSVNPYLVDEMVNAIEKMYENVDFRKKCGAYNLKKAKQFDIHIIDEIMQRAYDIECL